MDGLTTGACARAKAESAKHPRRTLIVIPRLDGPSPVTFNILSLNRRRTVREAGSDRLHAWDTDPFFKDDPLAHDGLSHGVWLVRPAPECSVNVLPRSYAANTFSRVKRL